MAERDGMDGDARGAPLRLTPDMASLRLQVLAFVRVYITRWGEGPSYGEIGEATGASRTAIKKAVRRLIAQGLLLRSPGARGLMLPDRRDEAIRVLRELGWTVDGDGARLTPPVGQDAGQEVTNRALLAIEVLDYDGGAIAARGTDDGAQEIQKKRRQAQSGASGRRRA